MLNAGNLTNSVQLYGRQVRFRRVMLLSIMGWLCAGLATAEGQLVITSSDPPDGAIDARRPSGPDGSNPAGWDSIDIVFSEDPSGLGPSDFSVAVNPSGIPPSIVSVVPVGGNVVTLTLDQYIPTGKWTSFTHIASGTTTRLGYLPADVNGDRRSAPDDVLRIIDHLNGCFPMEAYSNDIDRSGVCAPPDILQAIDLLNGAGVYDVWNGQTLPD